MMKNCNYEVIQVECYSSYKVNERPVAFTYQNHRREIHAILDCWYEGRLGSGRPVIDYFKVQTTANKIYLLRYLSAFDTWTLRPGSM